MSSPNDAAAEFAALPPIQQSKLVEIARCVTPMNGLQAALAGFTLGFLRGHLADRVESIDDVAETTPTLELCTLLIELIFADVEHPAGVV